MHNKRQICELLLQALETEIIGTRVYKMALRCVVDEDLGEEWEKYLGQTERHVRVLEDLCRDLGLDPAAQSPGRQIVRSKGIALVGAMEMALHNGDPRAAQLVAAEAVVDAETKDHLNWELIGKVSEELKQDEAKALRAAYEEIEVEEDEHLYHTQGWARELWLESLGLEAVLPPPEEKRDVRSVEEAALAKKQRKTLAKR